MSFNVSIFQYSLCGSLWRWLLTVYIRQCLFRSAAIAGWLPLSVRPLLSGQKRYNIVNSHYFCGGMLPVRVFYFLTPGCWHLPVFALKWQLAVPASLCSFVAGSRWGKKPRSSRHSDSHTDFRKEMALLYTEHCFRFICLALKVGSMCSRQVSIQNAGIE